MKVVDRRDICEMYIFLRSRTNEKNVAGADGEFFNLYVQISADSHKYFPNRTPPEMCHRDLFCEFLFSPIKITTPWNIEPMMFPLFFATTK